MLGRFFEGETALVGQFADQPVGLDGVFEPGLGKPLTDAGLDGPLVNFLTVAVK